nr:reverse transcriptase domain-containing protein [Tanacetum cinerariifolium]
MNNALNFQNQDFQNQPFSVPNNQIPPSVLNELLSYIKSNEIEIKRIQNQINVLRGDFNKHEENLRRNLKDDMRSILGSFFQYQPSTSGTLPSNTVPNPKVVPISILEPDVLRTQTKPTIPYPSSFADALLLMPKFASTTKSLLANKDKLFELAKVSLNENCLAMLLKKLPEKLGHPGASINLMPLSIWKKLSLPKLTPTRMTLELADRSITRPKGVAEDVFVKVGMFYFPTDFVVVDFKADPRVPLILRRSFLRTVRALINVYGEEITLRVNDESVTFNLNQVMRYSNNSVSRVNVINIASEEVVQDKPKSSNPTLGDILYLENMLKEDPFQLPPMNLNQAKSPIEEPEYSLGMGYEHFITTPVTELDEVAESSAKNLVTIQSEYEVTSNNESDYNEPIKDDSFSAFTTFTNPLFNDKDDFTIHEEDVPIEKSKDYSNPLFDNDEINSNELESHCSNIESNFVESLSKHDTVKKEHAEYISLMERLITINPCPRPTVNANTMVESLPSSREIDVVEELRVDNSIPNSKNELSKNEASDFDDPSFPRPPSEPPDVEVDFEPNSGEEISAVINDNDELECFNPGGEIDVSTNVEDDDYFPFTFVIRISLPYLIYPEVFVLFLSAESEDTNFDPRISV